jgi:hypothetical protein
MFRILLPVIFVATLSPFVALAAGNGAGAGGAGFQRAINSGLPAGEPGPLGSVNNPRRVAAPAPAAIKGAPHPETAATKPQ